MIPQGSPAVWPSHDPPQPMLLLPLVRTMVGEGLEIGLKLLLILESHHLMCDRTDVDKLMTAT